MDVSVGDGFSITVPNSVKLDCLNGHSRNSFFIGGGVLVKSMTFYLR